MDSIHVGSRICLGGEGLGLYSGKAITIHIENLSVNIKIGDSNKKNFYFIREIDAISASFEQFGYKVSIPEFIISTTIPSGYGLASSAALMYAIAIAFNNHNHINCFRDELEQIAYHAEHKILNILVGKTDTYAVSREGWTHPDDRPLLSCHLSARSYSVGINQRSYNLSSTRGAHRYHCLYTNFAKDMGEPTN